MTAKEQLERQRRALQRGKAQMLRRYRLSQFIDKVMATSARPLGMCGERYKWQRHYSRWTKATQRFSRLFQVECYCCTFYRGVTLGGGAGFIIGAACWALLT